MLRPLTLLGVFSLALTGVASAQAGPPGPPPGRPNGAHFAERGAAFTLRAAYRDISEAELHGASPYLDAAKAHYRDAVSRAQSNDRSAASEAMAASALARASIAERPLPAPRDIPSPPPLQGTPPMHGAPPRGPMMHERFDAAAVAADAKRAGTNEARDLAQKAVDANVAATHAGFSGNVPEAMRQQRVADALAAAVRSLADAVHPPQSRGRG